MQDVNGLVRISATDMANFLGCRHRTRLDFEVLRNGYPRVPLPSSPGAEALAERGNQHEARVKAEYESRGWHIEDLSHLRKDPDGAMAATREAIDARIDVIYQGALGSGDRFGFTDFLVRGDLLGGGGASGYEVVDAKLARTAKAQAVLQTVLYTRMLENTTGIRPDHMHLALGTGELLSLRVDDYAAYERQVSRMLDEFLADDEARELTYPDPVELCAMCKWRFVCIDKRHADDDLSLIAGISSRQRRALKDHDITTMSAFADLDETPTLDRVGPASLGRTQLQARLQVRSRREGGRPLSELVEPERDAVGELVPNRGLLGLPAKVAGDLYFDIEGARYYTEDQKEFGLQYLFGIVDSAELDAQGRPKYHAFWGFDREGERRAFEALVDFVVERLEANAGLHVYHYNHYEPTALNHLADLHESRDDVVRRLMGRFATREDEVDELLTRRVFVDLYRVIRQGVRVSEESYSIKSLERHYGYKREVALNVVNNEMVAFEATLDPGPGRAVGANLTIQGYNEDDCRSTLALRDWLEAKRDELAAILGTEPPRPVPPEFVQDATPPEIVELRNGLEEGLPAPGLPRTPEQVARQLLSYLLEFHRRERKPQWWRYFHLLELSSDELVAERDAIGGLTYVRDVADGGRTLAEFTFPEQEFKFAAGDRLLDPVSLSSWSLERLSEDDNVLWLLRSRQKQGVPEPTSLVPPKPSFPATEQIARLHDLARKAIAIGDAAWPLGAGYDLLLRRAPARRGDEPLRLDNETGADAGERLAPVLGPTCLPVQGPPGTGKTHTGATMILRLVEEGRKVGITAMSHEVIRNILDKVAELDGKRAAGAATRLGQKPKDDATTCKAVMDSGTVFAKNGDAADALKANLVDVVGGTTWLWADPKLSDSVDVLVVDEASQLPLADVLAVSGAAETLVLLGDPQQLSMPSQGSHPPEAKVSALEHVLNGEPVMPPDMGLFMSRTRRMHPELCAFTSEVFYRGQLRGIDGLQQISLLGEQEPTGTGFRVLDVGGAGFTIASPDEATAVAEMAAALMGRTWRDKEDHDGVIGPSEVLVVTPYNAQIREIRRALILRGLDGVRVGTVDKFQGKEAPVVIYSTASSSAEEAPRGMEFLYDLHRLNVATSRAMALVILVTSPDLVRVFCKTPHQMHLANALCRLRELAPIQRVELGA